MLTSARSAFLHCSRTTSLTSRTAVYGPVRTVVWQGSAGDCRPYADQTGFSVKCSCQTTQFEGTYRKPDFACIYTDSMNRASGLVHQVSRPDALPRGGDSIAAHGLASKLVTDPTVIDDGIKRPQGAPRVAEALQVARKGKRS